MHMPYATGYDWVIVDSQYLPSKPTRAEMLGWQEFLAQLGVTVFLVVQPRKVTFTADQLVRVYSSISYTGDTYRFLSVNQL